jgi:hypothetical protein
VAGSRQARGAVIGLGTMAAILFGAGMVAAGKVEPGSETRVVAGGAEGEEAAAAAADEPVPAEPLPAHDEPVLAPVDVLAASAEATTTTAPPPTAATTTTSKPAPVKATTTTAPPRTSTTAVTSVVSTPPGRWFTMSPTSGPSLTTVRVSGGGCTGVGAGVAIEISDPAGVPYSGDGAAAGLDGTWTFLLAMGANLADGPHTVRATCRAGGLVRFGYEPLVFTVRPVSAMPVTG